MQANEIALVLKKCIRMIFKVLISRQTYNNRFKYQAGSFRYPGPKLCRAGMWSLCPVGWICLIPYFYPAHRDTRHAVRKPRSC